MEGYARLASLMGAYPEVGIFRRFGALNAQNLLYLQAELVDLENNLRRIEKQNLESGDQDRSIYNRHWPSLAESTGDGNACGGEQWKLFTKIKEKLKEYKDIIADRHADEALLEQNQLAKLQPPQSRDLKFLVNWMKHPKMGNVYLLGQDSDIWECPDTDDIVAVQAREDEGMIARLIFGRLVRWYHHMLGWRIKKPMPAQYTSNTVYYSDAKLIRGLNAFSITVASLLPILSIVLLSFIVSLKKQLGIIALFTMIFSASLGTLTNGRSVEIFAATSAFAAVQVVFVGTN